jgi:hypothetical protein
MNGFSGRSFRYTALLIAILLLQPVITAGQGARPDSLTGNMLPDLQLTALKD